MRREKDIKHNSKKVLKVRVGKVLQYTVAINELICMKNVGSEIAMNFS